MGRYVKRAQSLLTWLFAINAVCLVTYLILRPNADTIANLLT